MGVKELFTASPPPGMRFVESSTNPAAWSSRILREASAAQKAYG
jgi:hypothetical protein